MNHLSRNLLVFACCFYLAPSEAAGLRKIVLPFELPVETEQANQIVHGRLDSNGKLTIDRVLKGNLNPKDPIQIERGKELFQMLLQICPQPGSIEVVLYLTKQNNGTWELLHYHRGVVFFHNDDVYRNIEGVLDTILAALERRETL